jgi:diguanylate cyclase (GGDEF)-like protein
MQAQSEHGFAAAYFRLLAARRDIEAVGVYAFERGGCRLVGATDGFAALVGAPELPRALADRVPVGEVVRLDPEELGLPSGFAAAAGGSAGLVLVVGRLPRRLTPGLVSWMRDAATLAAPLFARPAPAVRRADAAAPLRAAIRPRAAVQRLVEAAVRGTRGVPAVGLMIVDLDRFRAVNEALGASAGDALLAVTGTRLEQALDAGERLVRLEGDRFAVVAPREAAELRALARRLLNAVSQPLVLDGRTVVMQASIGGVAAARREPTPVLLDRAESALRRAKAEGRARFVLHEPAADAVALDRSRLEFDLAHAVANGQMHLAYQPYVDLKDGRVSGVEALLRWRHPARGELAPAAFIPMAEATGLILPLGRWALRAAMTRAVDWPEPMGLAVNISPLQFHEPGFLAEVDAALAETGFPPERLELEITETVLMRDNPETTAQLRALIARGIRIALDDFGTGYSALAYLARLPHHRIKLDKAFVQDLANPATAELIRAIIALARAQGIAVTAEGVERPEHLALVRRAGFTHAQGYATGAPVADPAALIARPPALPDTGARQPASLGTA